MWKREEKEEIEMVGRREESWKWRRRWRCTRGIGGYRGSNRKRTDGKFLGAKSRSKSAELGKMVEEGKERKE